MKQLTAEVKARKDKRKQEVEEAKQVNEDAKTIPCEVCGRTVMQVMEARALKMKAGEDAGLGGFHEKDGKTVFLCVDCGWKRRNPV